MSMYRDCYHDERDFTIPWGSFGTITTSRDIFTMSIYAFTMFMMDLYFVMGDF
jgi:hypothetical protein